MQTIELYGLTVDCEPCDYIPYMKFKAKLEQCIIELNRQLKNNKRKMKPACHFIRLATDKLFSIYITETLELQIGIYYAQTNRIEQNCRYEDICCIQPEDLDVLSLRMSNLIVAEGEINASTNVNHAWDILLARTTIQEYEDEYER